MDTRSNLINLTWEPSTDNVEVYRYDIYQNGIKAVVTESTSATIYNLVEGQLYNFVVKARDVTGNESPASNQVVAINLASHSGTGTAGSSCSLEWTEEVASTKLACIHMP